MPASDLLTGWPRHFVKTVTFDGSSGAGAIGTVAVATVSGRVQIFYGCAYCVTSLAGATATLEVGTANNTAGIIVTTTATDLQAGEIWRTATPTAEIGAIMHQGNLSADIIITVAVAAVTAGVLEFAFHWVPQSEGALLG